MSLQRHHSILLASPPVSHGRPNFRAVPGHTNIGRSQNFVHLVTGHTPGRINRNGTVPCLYIFKNDLCSSQSRRCAFLESGENALGVNMKVLSGGVEKTQLKALLDDPAHVDRPQRSPTVQPDQSQRSPHASPPGAEFLTHQPCPQALPIGVPPSVSLTSMKRRSDALSDGVMQLATWIHKGRGEVHNKVREGQNAQQTFEAAFCRVEAEDFPLVVHRKVFRLVKNLK